MIIKPKFSDNGLPLQEYPRPQFARDSYFCLNGEWNYAITEKSQIPSAYDGKITVPYSPESSLSGVNRQLQKDEYLYYNRKFTLPEGFNKGRVFINFGAVDQVCEVFLNGKFILINRLRRSGRIWGGRGRWRYLPFS